MPGLAQNIPGSVLSKPGLTINMAKHILNMTGLSLNLPGFAIKMPECLWNMTGFSLNLPSFVLKIPRFDLDTPLSAQKTTEFA